MHIKCSATDLIHNVNKNIYVGYKYVVCPKTLPKEKKKLDKLLRWISLKWLNITSCNLM